MIIKILNYAVQKFFRPDFSFDGAIPSAYLISYAFMKITGLLKGALLYRKFMFVGTDVKIRANSLFIVGAGCSIDDGSILNALSASGVVFGKNVSVHKRSVIECTGSLRQLGLGLTVGDNVGIGSNSFLGCAGGVEIGDETIIGNYVSFHSENHNFSDLVMPIRDQGVNHRGIKIGRNCWVGAKVTILDGTIVGDGCVIAAGAVLNGKSYPSNSIIAGVPARVIGSRG